MRARERMTKLDKHGDISGLGARIKILRCDGGAVFFSSSIWTKNIWIYLKNVETYANLRDD